MAGLLAVDRRLHVHDAVVPLGEAGDLHGGAVGDLLLQVPEHLLADDLRDDLALGLVGAHALGEEPGALHGVLLAGLQQILHALAGLGGDGNDGLECKGLVVGGDNGQELFLVLHLVDLVDDQNGGDPQLPEAGDQRLLLGAEVGNGLHQQQAEIHVGDGVLHHGHHIIAQLGPGLVEARGIHKDELGVAPVQDAADPVPGGLGLVGDDGDLLAHQGIRQGGLAHVGPSANGDHTGFGVHSYLSLVFR